MDELKALLKKYQEAKRWHTKRLRSNVRAQAWLQAHTEQFYINCCDQSMQQIKEMIAARKPARGKGRK